MTFQFGVNHPFKPTHFPPKNSPGSDSADETLSCGRLMAVTVCCDPGHRVKWLAVRRAHLGPMQGAATAAIQLDKSLLAKSHLLLTSFLASNLFPLFSPQPRQPCLLPLFLASHHSFYNFFFLVRVIIRLGSKIHHPSETVLSAPNAFSIPIPSPAPSSQELLLVSSVLEIKDGGSCCLTA